MDEKETALLRAEAKRLHITIEELNVLLEQLHDERENAKHKSMLPLHVIAEHPDHAVVHYKMLLSQISELALLTDATKFEQAAKSTDSLTAKELAVWQQIKARS